jgi:phosphatidylglycerophosphatase A
LSKQEKTLLQRFAEISATGYGLGLAKKAPGTWGSLGGLVLGWLIYKAGFVIAGGGQHTYFFIAVSILLTALSAFGFWTIKRAEAEWGTHDEGKIVIDEFAGQAIAVAFFTPSIITYIAGFILFRIFDIWKPSIIGKADETLPGAWGTLVDDLIAGAAAAVCLAGLLYALSPEFVVK